METSTITNLFSHNGTVLAAIFFIASVAWFFVRQFLSVNSRLRRFSWGLSFANLVILPVATYSAGLVIQSILNGLGLTSWLETVRELTQLAIFLAIAMGLARLVELKLETSSRDGQPAYLSQLAKSALFCIFLLIGVLAFLLVNNFTPNKLYVSTGAVAAIVAFAMQQTLGDLFSGIAVSIERPFRIGDWLRFEDGSEGEVIDVNWRSTHLKSWTEGTYVIPNSKLSRQQFLNLHGSNHPYAQFFDVQVSNRHDPRIVADILTKAVMSCESVLDTPAPSARLKDGSTLPYTYYVWVYFKNYPSMFAGREEIYLEIDKALKLAGFEVATNMTEIRHAPIGGEGLK